MAILGAFPPIMSLLSSAGSAAAGQIPTLLGAVGSAAAWGGVQPLVAEGVDRMLHGSPEAQMKRQLEMQRAMEAQEQGDLPLGGLAGAPRRPATLSELVGDEMVSRKLADTARQLDRTRRAPDVRLQELEELIAGNHARIAQLAAPRGLSALEVISMLEGG